MRAAGAPRKAMKEVHSVSVRTRRFKDRLGFHSDLFLLLDTSLGSAITSARSSVRRAHGQQGERPANFTSAR